MRSWIAPWPRECHQHAAAGAAIQRHQVPDLHVVAIGCGESTR
jgi:hypothetical protein